MNPYVHPQTRALLGQLAAAGAPKLSQIGAVAGRDYFRALGGLMERPAPELAGVSDLSADGVPVRLYTPLGAPAEGPLLLFFHGGGWVIGNLDSHHSLCATLADGLGLALLSVDYRLAPEHPFPAAYEDCLAVARWAAGAPAALGRAVPGLVLTGDSAGGNLAASVAQALAAVPAAVPVLAQLLLYPVTNLTARGGSSATFATGYLLEQREMEWFQDQYADRAMQADPRVSPLFGALEGQPPTVLVTCGLDPLRDQGRAYAARLVEAGVRVSYHELAGMVHGCFSIRGAIPAAHDALLAAVADLRAMLERP